MASLPKDDDEALDLTPLDAGDDDALPLDGADDGSPASEGLDGDDEPLEIVIEGVTEAEKQPEGDALVRHLRQVTKAQLREIAALKAASQVQTVEPELPPLGPEPTLETCGWDDAELRKQTREWLKLEAAHEAAKAKAKEQQESFKAQIEADIQRYQDGKAKLAGVDFDEVEAVVSAKLNAAYQVAIVRAAEKPEHVMAALAKYPAKLAEVAAITDPTKLGAWVARLEGAIKVSNMKRNPAPERRVAGGTAPLSGGAADKHIERLRAEAAKTGDYSAVAAYKRKMANR